MTPEEHAAIMEFHRQYVAKTEWSDERRNQEHLKVQRRWLDRALYEAKEKEDAMARRVARNKKRAEKRAARSAVVAESARRSEALLRKDVAIAALMRSEARKRAAPWEGRGRHE